MIALVAAVAVAALAVPASAAVRASAAPTTKLRVFHDSADTPQVDFYLDGKPFYIPIGFNVLGFYGQGVTQGAHEVEVKLAPSTPASPNLLARRFTFGANPVTVALIGSSRGDGAGLRLVAFNDVATRLGAVFRVRFVHTVPDAPAIDVQTRVAGLWAPVVLGLRFGSASGYLVLPGGLNSPIRITRHLTNQVLLNLPQVPLEGGKSYSIYLNGFLTPASGSPAIAPFGAIDT
jgi:hypothetical protein